MQRGEIWVVSLDPASGHEQKGRRPVMVISPGRFNQLTEAPVVLPITTKGGFARTAGFAVSLDNARLKTVGIVRCDQPRVIDLKARHGRYVETATEGLVDEVLAKVSVLFE